MMLARLSRDQSGSTAAEFGLVLPLLLLLLFGVIDTGRWIWTYNQAEKATQMGARFAVVANPTTSGLSSSYLGVSGLTQGDIIPPAAFGKITCTDASCTCTTNPCPALGTFTQQNFRNVVNRMKLFLPGLQYSNVKIEYSSSGLGFAGSPVLPDLSPMVTVKIGENPATAMQFRPLSTLAIASVNMPSFTTTLSAEDLSGSVSN
jgi:Flp pilus assembly pilin Flp